MNNGLKTALVVSAAIHASILFLPGNLFKTEKKVCLKVDREKEIMTDMILPEVNVLSDIRKMKKNTGKPETKRGIDPASSEGKSEKAMFRYQDMVLQKIQSKRKYPYAAKRHGREGIAVVGFSINRNGALKSAELVSSSGEDILDYEAVNTIKRAAPYPAIPDGLFGDTFDTTVSVVFRLNP